MSVAIFNARMFSPICFTSTSCENMSNYSSLPKREDEIALFSVQHNLLRELSRCAVISMKYFTSGVAAKEHSRVSRFQVVRQTKITTPQLNKLQSHSCGLPRDNRTRYRHFSSLRLILEDRIVIIKYATPKCCKQEQK